MDWPSSTAQLFDLQESLGAAAPDQWQGWTAGGSVGGVFVCFGRGGSGPGEAGDTGWGGAAVVQDGRIVAGVAVTGSAGGAYRRGYLAVREGPLLETAVRALVGAPEVLLVNATGLDHPRRAGLAVQLGAVLGIPTIGVTHRPLLAGGEWPRSNGRAASSRFSVGGEVVGCWVRTQAGCRPLAVHAGWRTSPDTARAVVLASTSRSRTPDPLREARRLARTARHDAGRRSD